MNTPAITAFACTIFGVLAGFVAIVIGPVRIAEYIL